MKVIFKACSKFSKGLVPNIHMKVKVKLLSRVDSF